MKMSKIKFAAAAIAAGVIGPTAVAGACGDEGEDYHGGTTAAHFGSYAGLPQYGHEPVRGHGCGGDGSIGEDIPDGYFAGYIQSYSPDGYGGAYIDVDLACVYYGESAQSILAQGNDTLYTGDPNYLVVNNQTRTRSAYGVTMDSWSGGVWDGSGFCTEVPEESLPDPIDPQLAWIHVSGGTVDSVFIGCI